MYNYTAATPFKIEFNAAEYSFVTDHLQGEELADFRANWEKQHVNGVQFWLDTVAFRKGLPCRWQWDYPHVEEFVKDGKRWKRNATTGEAWLDEFDGPELEWLETARRA